MRSARLRIHGSAGDLLPFRNRNRPFHVWFELPRGLRDIIQSTGVPHVELGKVRINGVVVDYSARVDDGDEVEAWSRYPLSRPPADPAFLLDGHLGRLAHYLRLFGFDTEHDPRATDSGLARDLVDHRRVLLTRDRGLLMRRELRHASFVRATDPHRQITEILHRFALRAVANPLTRCLECNGRLRAISGADAAGDIPDLVGETHDEFSRCDSCGRTFWKGSHYRRLRHLIDQTMAELSGVGM